MDDGKTNPKNDSKVVEFHDNQLKGWSWNSLLKSFYEKQDNECKKGLDSFIKIFDCLKDFSYDHETKIPKIVLLLLLKRIQEYNEKKKKSDQLKPIQISIDTFEDVKRISQFAFDVYFASNDSENAKKHLTGITDEDEIYVTYFDNYKESDDEEFSYLCPKFMIFTDKTSKSIVLAIKGSFQACSIILFNP